MPVGFYASALAAIAISSLGSVASAADPVSAEKLEIGHLEDAWRQARIDGDIGFLEQFYAREMRVQGMDGKVQSKAQDIAMFADHKIKPKFIDHGPLDITTYGQTAVVTGLDHLGGTFMGHYGEMYLRFTDVLVKRDGRWQLVIQQATPSSSD